MKKLFKKFKNIHFLWIVGVICFLTFYVPVAIFTDYSDYLPEWTLPFFIIGSVTPLWINEFLWRSARFNSGSYMMFHDIHFENKKWVKQTANVWLVLSKYGAWILKQKMFWIVSIINMISLYWAYTVTYSDNEIHPFTFFYIVNSIWWITIIKDFVGEFKEQVNSGRIKYGKIDREHNTQFSMEWYEEKEREFNLNELRRKKRMETE